MRFPKDLLGTFLDAVIYKSRDAHAHAQNAHMGTHVGIFGRHRNVFFTFFCSCGEFMKCLASFFKNQ